MIPFYTAQDDDQLEGMDYMGLVDHPAHQKSWVALNQKQEKPVKMKFNDDLMEVTGVGIAANLPIYRNDQFLGEHYLVFKAKHIKRIVEKMMSKGYHNNVNEMHDLNRDVKGITFLEGWFWDSQRGKTDSYFEGQNIKDGSWMVTYKVSDPKIWQKIKSGEWAGFSIEGWFKKVPLKINGSDVFKSNSKPKKVKKGKFWKALFGEKEEFETVTTTDNVEISWEGELAEGTEIFVMDEDGEQVLAPEGQHAFENEDMSMTVITVDANGMVEAIETVMPEEAGYGDKDEDEEDDFNAEVVANAIQKISEKLSKEFQASIEGLKADFEAKLTKLAAELDEMEDSGDKKKFNRKEKKNVDWRKHSK
jgi:hypothetical protein